MNSYILEFCPINTGSNMYTNGVRLSSEDAGVDVFTIEDVQLTRYENTLLSLGTAARLINKNTGKDSHYQLVPRSSIYKFGVGMANSVGIIDKGYRGELKAPIICFKEESFIPKGTRLFQIIAPNMDQIEEVRIVDSLPDSKRGTGGFGSTG